MDLFQHAYQGQIGVWGPWRTEPTGQCQWLSDWLAGWSSGITSTALIPRRVWKGKDDFHTC